MNRSIEAARAMSVRKPSGHQAGFTFLEAMTVAVIVAVLAAVAIPSYNGYIASQKRETATNIAKSAAVTLSSIYRRTGAVPNTDAGIKAVVALPEPAKYEFLVGPDADPTWVQVRESADHSILSIQAPFRN